MQENDVKNDDFSQKNVKICYETPVFDVTKFLEHTSDVSEVVLGQAVSIRELLIRAERGQRLGVQMHDPDFVSSDIPEGTPGVDESLDDVPPEGMDLSEFDEYARGVYADKQAFEAKRKKASEEAEKPAENNGDNNKE